MNKKNLTVLPLGLSVSANPAVAQWDLLEQAKKVVQDQLEEEANDQLNTAIMTAGASYLCAAYMSQQGERDDLTGLKCLAVGLAVGAVGQAITDGLAERDQREARAGKRIAESARRRRNLRVAR